MRNPVIPAVAAVLLIGFCVTACQRPSAAPVVAPVRVLRLVGAFAFDPAFLPQIASTLGASLRGVRVDIRSVNGQGAALLMLQRGEADAVFTNAAVAHMALTGQIPQMFGRFDDLRAIAELRAGAVQAVVRPHSAIRSIADLRGRRVSLGLEGGAIALISELVLRAYGISLSDLNAEYMESSDAAREVISGEIDAAFWHALPHPSVAQALQQGARILDVIGPEIDRFRAEYPFLKPTVIPTATYPGSDDVVRTMGIDGIFVCRAELAEVLVHDLTRAFIDLSQSDLDIGQVLPTNLSSASSTAIPLHPGAARFYRERELLR